LHCESLNLKVDHFAVDEPFQVGLEGCDESRRNVTNLDADAVNELAAKRFVAKRIHGFVAGLQEDLAEIYQLGGYRQVSEKALELLHVEL
jgi:hypothetical protein